MSSSLCVKCKTVESSIDIKFAIYCSPCFQEATYHKYRTMLARSRDSSTTTTSSTGLILFPRNFLKSPQLYRASRVLLHFSQLPGIQEPARKNLVSYDLVVPVGSERERDQVEGFVQEVLREYPKLGQIYIIPIEQELSEPFESCTTVMNDSIISELSGLSNTLKEDLFNAKLLHSQLKLMKTLGIERALTPETSTALASYILTCTCKGRGKFLPWDSALIRSFPDELFLCRPLKDISDKEVELYCQEVKFNEPSVYSSTSTTNISALSIDQLTVNFLTNLEAENPGTSNVVIRTSSKVTTTNGRLCDGSSDRCKICLAPNNEGICESCKPLKEYFI